MGRKQLLEAMESVEDNAALLSLREYRPQYVKRSYGASFTAAFGRSYSLLGFSIVDVPEKIRSRSFRADPNRSHKLCCEKVRTVPYAPYGGFFFKAELLSKIGLPSKAFYLHEDDHEFTRRFVAKRYPIYLVPPSRIADAQPSWHQDRPRRSRWVGSWLLTETEAAKMGKLYYSIRNRMFFEMHSLRWHKNPLYAINVLSYLTILFSQAFLMRLNRKYIAWQSFLVIIGAVKDALHSRLGKVEAFDI